MLVLTLPFFGFNAASIAFPNHPWRVTLQYQWYKYISGGDVQLNEGYGVSQQKQTSHPPPNGHAH